MCQTVYERKQFALATNGQRRVKQGFDACSITMWPSRLDAHKGSLSEKRQPDAASSPRAVGGGCLTGTQSRCLYKK